MTEVPRSEVIKVNLAASLGTLLEWYDFFVAAFTAALVWPYTHLPPGNPVAAVGAAIAAYGSVFFVRPIAAFIFGHFGDKIGRKNVMVWTLVIMGLGTLGIGLTPDYNSIGIWAIVLITLFRLVQGLGIGGEWGGAATWVSEFYARGRWRALATSFLQAVNPAGQALAALSFFLLLISMPRADFLSFGWRIAFYVGFIVAIIGAIIRYKLLESPLFQKALERREILKLPAVTVLKEKWATVLLLAAAWQFVGSMANIMVLTYAGALVPRLGLPSVVHTVGLIIAGLSGFIANILGGFLGDFIGRRWTIFISALLVIIFTYPFFILILTKDLLQIYLAYALFYLFIFIGYGPLPAYMSEHFETKYRFSGNALAYQIGSVLIGIGTSFILPFVLNYVGNIVNAWPYVAAIAAGFGILSMIAIFILKETKASELK
jgi:MFS family permease